MKKWCVNPFSTTSLGLLRKGGMISASCSAESIFRDCTATPLESPHHYAGRLLAAARIQQLMAKHTFVHHRIACEKFIGSWDVILPGMKERAFQIMRREYDLSKPVDLYVLADCSQRAYLEWLAAWLATV
jgi:hypothetical protein